MKLNKYLIMLTIAIASISLIGCSKNDQVKKEDLQTTFNMSDEETKESEEEKENIITTSIDSSETTLSINNSETQDIIKIPDKQLTREEKKEKYIKLLIGSWKSQEDGALEFLEDGTFTYLSSKNKTYDGKWEVDTTASPYLIISVSVKSALAAGDTVVGAETLEYLSSGKLFSIFTDEQGKTILSLASKSETLEGDIFIKIE